MREAQSDRKAKSVREGRPSKGRSFPPFYLILPALAVGVSMLLPLIYLGIRSVEVGGTFFDLLLRPRSLQVMWNSLLLAVSVGAAAIAIGVPLGWLIVRSDLPGRRFWSAASVVPLAIPSLVGGFTFVAAFGSGGIVPRFLSTWIDPRLIPSAYGFWGAWALLTLLTYPYVLLPVRSTLRGMDPAQEEAARSLGHSGFGILRHVLLPGLKPAVLSGGLLAALYTLSDFSAVSLLQFDSFTRAIYVQYQASFNRHYAAVLSVALVAVTGGVLLLEHAVRGRGAYHRSGTGTGRKPPRVALGRWRWPALAFVALITLVSVGLPIGVTLYWLVRGIAQGEAVIFSWQDLTNSVTVSLLAAVVTVAAALPIALLSVRHRSPLSTALEKAAFIGYALPGIVVAVSLVFFGARVGPPFYQSTATLLLAYVVLFLPQALTSLRASLLQVSPNVENVARSLGHSTWSVLLRVTLPLIRPGLVTGGALVFLTVIKELPATLLLSPIGFRTLATSIWSSVSEAFYARAAGPTLILIIVSAFSLALLLRGEGAARSDERRR